MLSYYNMLWQLVALDHRGMSVVLCQIVDQMQVSTMQLLNLVGNTVMSVQIKFLSPAFIIKWKWPKEVLLEIVGM